MKMFVTESRSLKVKLTISEEIISKVLSFKVIAYTMDVDNLKTKKVDNYLSFLVKEYQNKYDKEAITKIPKLKETRDGYKAFGKDPSHTRPACEAILRRFVGGSGIYRLGDIIDLGNIISLITKRSVCVVDADLIQGNITIRLGRTDESFYGINRGLINVDKLPVYVDDIGPFGSPTSDTERTKVTNTTKSILVMIICFSELDMGEDEKIMLEIYQKYAQARNIKKIEVNYGKL